jgi:hypothetical protein
MVFPPPDNPSSPPTTDEDEVWPGQRCTLIIAEALPRGPTSAERDAPVPLPTEDYDCEEVRDPIDFG